MCRKESALDAQRQGKGFEVWLPREPYRDPISVHVREATLEWATDGSSGRGHFEWSTL